jgi:uncharacterized membrane protein
MPVKKKAKSKTDTATIIANQKKILKKLDKILTDEDLELKHDLSETEELEKIVDLEKSLSREIKEKPLRKITYRDFSKSIVGAFFGVLGHFAFFYGVKISHEITIMRASILYIVAFFIGVLFIYLTGFRKIQHKKHLIFVPIRLLVIYFTSIVVVIAVLSLFGYINNTIPFTEIYKQVAAVSILAVMGAATADLIGKE